MKSLPKPSNLNTIGKNSLFIDLSRMEPFLHKAIQNLVREHDPQYVSINQQDQELDNDKAVNLREFSVAWYGIESVHRQDFSSDQLL